MLLVNEIFHSLQGETTLTGVRFAFIRLSGCNLRCSYCDTTYAFKGGRKMGVDEVVAAVRPFGVEHALVTGGEPLMQRPTPDLVRALKRAGYSVSVETSGEAPIAAVGADARIILDIKTPSSGMCRGGFRSNLPLLKPDIDEIKIVIASPDDYAWARDLVRSGGLPKGVEILFSPALPARNAPGAYPGVDATWLAERMIEDRLPVRMQYQLHKLLWGADRRGV